MIGERFDADAGLQFLNARYYDPKLAMFIQPDWWEVMQAGVGVNRYGYAGNDPINGMDPGGNSWGSDFIQGLKDTWQGIKDTFSGNVTHIGNAGGDHGGNYGVVHVNGTTYGCFGCSGTGGRAAASVAQAYSEVNSQADQPWDRIPDGISDAIFMNKNLGLTVVNGVLSGTVGLKCSASSGWCGRFVKEASRINRPYGTRAINVSFSLMSNGLIAVARGPAIGGGLWESAYQKITINGMNALPGFFGDVVRHEIGHMLGLRHQDNSTDRLMSYSSDRPSFFSTVEVERLIDAYQ